MTDQLTDGQTGPTYQVSWVETKNSETRQGALQRLGLAYVYTVVDMTLTAVKASLISILDTNHVTYMCTGHVNLASRAIVDRNFTLSIMDYRRSVYSYYYHQSKHLFDSRSNKCLNST